MEFSGCNKGYTSLERVFISKKWSIQRPEKKHDAQSIVNLLCERDAIEERKDSLEQKIAVIKASDAYSKEGTSKELYSFGGALLSAISLFTAFLKGIIYYVNKDD